MTNSKTKGNLAEAKVLAALVEKGYNVLQPFGDNQRYDLAIDDNGKLLRVQVKHGRLRQGCVLFNACSTTYDKLHGRGRLSTGYKDQADLFGVYCPETNEVYLVPVEEIGHTIGTLRVDPPKQNQAKRIRYARDFKVA